MATADLLIAPYGLTDGQANLPNPTQGKVLEWMDNCKGMPVDTQDHIPVLYLQGGVGSGKTRALLAPVIELLTQIAGIRILWGRNDFKDLKLSIMDKFFEILPIELVFHRNEQYHYYEFDLTPYGLSNTFYLTIDAQMSATDDVIYFDEIRFDGS